MNNINLVSRCCHGSIVEGHKMEYPDGERCKFWGYRVKCDVCEECGQEVEEPIEQCSICGEDDCHGECEQYQEEENEISPYPVW